MDDLIAEFVAETSESLGMLDSELVKLEQNPDDTEILGNIFRLVHTIKGTCGFLGLPRLASVAHAGENVLGKVREREIPVNSTSISMILQSLDRIKLIMEALTTSGSEPEGSDEELINALNAFADANGGVSAEIGNDIDFSNIAEDKPVEVVAEATEANRKRKTIKSKESHHNETPLKELENKPELPEVKSNPQHHLPESLKQEAIKQGISSEDSGGGLAGQTIRVSLSVLENLMQMVGELVLTRNQLLQLARSKNNDDFTAPLQHLSHITTELQEGVMKTRMQPISNAWAKFPRLIRDLSMELNKKIELKMIGAETELDRQLLEMIKDPLTHMVRNSCDHGLETPEERIAGGKNPIGTVTLSAFHEGGHIIIQITDDGRGVNLDRVKQKAIENGLASLEEIASMSDNQIIQFIFKAGFSTAEKITSVSGRGVGMDVVRTNIEKIGGTVELESKFGRGSTFHIKIPLTLAIVSVLIVETAGQRFALPQINVLELVKTEADGAYRVEMINRSPVLRLRDKLLPLISLSNVLKIPDTNPTNYNEAFIVVCKVGGSEFGLIVDSIHDTEEIVVKPVSRCLQHIPIYSGNTVLGDGSVIMILDPNGISKTTEAELEAQTQRGNLSDNQSNGSQINFLLFKTNGETPKAVALELVSRLEEIEVSQIEYSSGKPVVQYRGALMRLTTTPDHSIPEEGECEVIVFNYDGKTVGLVVKEITDIVSAEPIVQLSYDDSIYHGSIVLQGNSTDVLDVGKLLGGILQKASTLNLMEPEKAKSTQVLFVEDSMFFRNLTIPFLTEVGLQVTSATDGVEALKILEKNNFDIIITDIEMPNMDGFQLAESVRAIERFNHVPIYAFTANTSDNFAKKAKDCGMNGYIIKTERNKLLATISSIIELELES
jgi:two-component system chemotaxis sensor kinase CheA